MLSEPSEHAHYPELSVRVRSPNPYALVAAAREELRRAGVDRAEIHRFTDQALADPDDTGHVLETTREWIGGVEALDLGSGGDRGGA